jgi:hypothetical protein
MLEASPARAALSSIADVEDALNGVPEVFTSSGPLACGMSLAPPRQRAISGENIRRTDSPVGHRSFRDQLAFSIGFTTENPVIGGVQLLIAWLLGMSLCALLGPGPIEVLVTTEL